MGVPPYDEVHPVDFGCQILVGRKPEMTQDHDVIGFRPYLIDQREYLTGGIAELEGLHVRGHDSRRGFNSGNTDDTHADAGEADDGIRLDETLSRSLYVDVGAQYREPRVRLPRAHDLNGVVEFVISQCHGVVADEVHPQNIGFRLEEVGQDVSGAHIAGVENQGVWILAPDPIHIGLPRGEPPGHGRIPGYAAGFHCTRKNIGKGLAVGIVR
jgi:hypothetical protein